MNLAPLAVAVPLLAAGGLIALGRRAGQATANLVGLLAAISAAALCVALLVRTGAGTDVYWFGGWEPRNGIVVGVDFAVDAFGAGLAAFAALLCTVSLVLLIRYRETDPPHLQVLICVFCAGMIGFCLSGDLFNMFVFFELMSVSAFALAGFKVAEEEAVEGALNFAVTNTIGSFLLLIGIGMVYGRTGALNLAQVGQDLSAAPPDGLVVIAFVLIACGFLVKAAIVPFHFWLADAYAVAPGAVCLVFAGAMSELGIYGVGRVWFASFGGALAGEAEHLGLVLIVAGSITAVVGGGMCLAQDHLKRMLAFATISYAGAFLIGLGLLDSAGAAGAALFVITDGLAKALLFAAVAILQHRVGRVSERRLRGRGRAMPFTGLLFLAGALSFAGIPPFGSFEARALIEEGLAANGYGWAIAALVLGSMLTGAAALRAAARIFLGWGSAGDRPPTPPRTEEEPEEAGEADRTPAVLFVPALLLGAGAFAVGLVPGVREAFEGASERFVDGASYSAAVLTGTAVGPPPVAAAHAPAASAYVYAALGAAGACAIALAALFGPATGHPVAIRARSVVDRSTRPLRSMHSGHVGDYVAWLVLGAAVFGAAAATSLLG